MGAGPILLRRQKAKLKGSDFVFHFLSKPINYCTIQSNFRSAQRKSGITYTGTHILRHGMATLARQVAGGLDAVIAMTGHKDIKLADHYSKIDDQLQKETSLQIMSSERFLNAKNQHKEEELADSNIVELFKFRKTI